MKGFHGAGDVRRKSMVAAPAGPKCLRLDAHGGTGVLDRAEDAKLEKERLQDLFCEYGRPATAHGRMIGEFSDFVQEIAVTRRREYETLLSEMTRRRAEDPLAHFEPHEVQKRFIRSVLYGEKEENYYLGGNRSGKTDAGSFIGATLARFGYPDDSPLSPRYVRGQDSEVSVRDRATSGWVSALDFATSRDTVQPKYFDNGFVPPSATHRPFIPQHEILEWRQNDQVLKLKNGSILGFKSADSGRLKYQGAEKNWVHIDEEHPEGIYNEIVIRVGATRLNVYTTATILPPEGSNIGGITWLFPRVIRPWQKGDTPKIGIFRASIYDNPHIDKGEIERLEARFPPNTVQGRIRLGGELIPGMAGARIYGSFERGLNTVAEQPLVNPYRPLVWTWDFNVEPMVSLVGQQDAEFHRVYRELILEEGSLPLMVDEFRRHYPSHRSEIIIHGDASGQARSHQSRQSSYTMILNCMMDYPAPVSLRVPFVNPSVDSRVQAVNRACRDEQGRRLLLIHDSCEELITDFENVVSDGRGGIKKSSNKKDSYFKRTHTSDALGYWISWSAPVVSLQRQTARGGLKVRRPSYG